jgi:hypothetical protein
MTAYLDDVTNTTNGQRDPASNDFNSTPSGWVGVNNHFTARDYIVRPYHQFGWAKTLSHLDGLNGYSPMYTIRRATVTAWAGSFIWRVSITSMFVALRTVPA